MKSALFTAALVALIGNVGASPTPKYAVHEKRASSSRTWIRGERVERDAVLPIRIGLTQNNLDDGERFLMDV